MIEVKRFNHMVEKSLALQIIAVHLSGHGSGRVSSLHDDFYTFISFMDPID